VGQLVARHCRPALPLHLAAKIIFLVLFVGFFILWTSVTIHLSSKGVFGVWPYLALLALVVWCVACGLWLCVQGLMIRKGILLNTITRV
jgi:uncharacterized membrane protein YdbT with pleckstrin-like domain